MPAWNASFSKQIWMALNILKSSARSPCDLMIYKKVINDTAEMVRPLELSRGANAVMYSGLYVWPPTNATIVSCMTPITQVSSSWCPEGSDLLRHLDDILGDCLDIKCNHSHLTGSSTQMHFRVANLAPCSIFNAISKFAHYCCLNHEWWWIQEWDGTHGWVVSWQQLSLNVNKTKDKKRKSGNHMPTFIDESVVERVNNYKFLLISWMTCPGPST